MVFKVSFNSKNSIIYDGKETIYKIMWCRKMGTGFKLKEGRFKSDIRRKIFIVREMRNWHRLLRGVVDVPFLKCLRPCWMGL